MKNNNLTILSSVIGLSLAGLTISPVASAGTITSTCAAGHQASTIAATMVYGTTASPSAGDCGSSKNVYKFEGDAASEIDKFGTEIEAAGKEIAETISANATAEINVMTENNALLMKHLTTISNSEMKDALKQDKMLLDMEMDYLSELNERELKASQGVMGMDDTKEEVLFILNELNVVGNGEEGAYNHSHEVIAAMKSKYDDDPAFMMPIRIKAGDAQTGAGEGCADYDPVAHKNGTLDGSCFYGVKASPGAKLEKYFDECSRLKAQSVASVKKNMAKTVSTASQKKAQSSYLNKSQTQKSADLAQAKMVEQKETSCSVKEFGYKICGKNEDGEQLETTEYLTKVIDLEIVPYGNVSSSNYLSPVAVGSTDGNIGDLTDDEMAAMVAKSLEYKKIDPTDPDSQPSVAVSTNTPKIVKTYRTSAQYFAAQDFVSNLVNKEAVSGINVTRSTNASNAMFQSKFMARSASLSLAENSLRTAIEIRTGSSVSEKVQEATAGGDDFNREAELVREDINGAGSLDVMIHLVDKDYNRLQSDAKAVISGGGSSQVSTSPNKVGDWQVEALIKSNQLALMQFEQNERIELLLAALLANTTNSEANINYINSLKLK